MHMHQPTLFFLVEGQDSQATRDEVSAVSQGVAHLFLVWTLTIEDFV
jgi:hypothetical protein